MVVRIAVRGGASKRASLAACGGELRVGNRLPSAAAIGSAGPPSPGCDTIPERLTHSELGRDRWSSEGGPGGRPVHEDRESVL